MLRHVIAGFAWALTIAAPASAAVVAVNNTGTLVKAIEAAEPGDEIVLADGVYALGRTLKAAAEGSRRAPIVMRARNRLKAEIRVSAIVGFEVSAPYWTFRDLDIRGTCNDDSLCEHAFHVTGAAENFRLIGNRLADFNAHLKVNAVRAILPVGGLVENNEFFNTRPRHTEATVAPLNIDHGTEWMVRGNFIHDFFKDQGDQVSYGAYVKGGAENPVFERNLVVCRRSGERGGSRIGLSFGGGGIAPQFCAPYFQADTPCEHEVTGGIMRNNIIANCSDAGIYLNAATGTQILFNTLVRTKGVEFRFQGSSGEATGNLTAAEIRGRDGGAFKDGGNMTRLRAGDFEDLYQEPDTGDLRLLGKPDKIAGKAGPDPRVADDYCGRKRGPGPLDMGALQSSLGDCPTLR